MPSGEIKVALVGCGQIADAHLQEVWKVAGASVVAVCDREPDLARQAAARFGVPGVFDDFGRMLDRARPDVVHVTTPPRSHRPLALQALAAGAHVYVEKPFAVDAAEAREVFGAARAAGRLACAGHDQLFDPAWAECRRRVASGAIGRVVHVDSYQFYDLSGPFGRAFAGDPDHWVRGLPGGLFQNVMSHALYRATDLLGPGRPGVSAAWFGESRGGGLPTELRASLLWPEATAQLVFSSAARPLRRFAKVQGSRGGFEVDLDAQLVRSDWGARAPGAFGKIEVPLRALRESSGQAASAAVRFLRARIHYFAGMKTLFEAFYEAVRSGGACPVPEDDVVRDASVMDDVFEACRDGRAAGCRLDPAGAPGRSP